MTLKRLILVWVTAMVTLIASAQGPLRAVKPEDCGMDGTKLLQIDRVIEEAISDKTIPGAVVSVHV